jgi:hypothetical protein
MKILKAKKFNIWNYREKEFLKNQLDDFLCSLGIIVVTQNASHMCKK